MTEGLYKPLEDDHIDKRMASVINKNTLQIPVARLYSNTYLIGTELAFPYV